MALKKISDTEAVSADGFRLLLGKNALSYVKESRYLTIPIGFEGDEVRVYLQQTSPWMENGKPCETDGTLNITAIRTRIAEALTLFGKKFGFDS